MRIRCQGLFFQVYSFHNGFQNPLCIFISVIYERLFIQSLETILESG